MAVRGRTNADPMGAADFAARQGALVEVVRHHESEEQVENRQGRHAARSRAQGTSLS